MSNPKDVKIVGHEQKGEWDSFTGDVGGKKVEVDIHRKDLVDKTRSEQEALIKRSLRGTANIPPDAYKERA